MSVVREPSEGAGVFVDAAGVRLHAVVDRPPAGTPERPPALVLHGFTGSAESMACVAGPLARRRIVVRLELIGHGRSEAPRDVARYAMHACVDQIGAALEGLGLERPHLVGYSMGGRAALAAAVALPARFASVTLVGATAGIEDPVARADRVRADAALADRIEREGVAAFVDHWMALPLFASQQRLGRAALARARAARLRNTALGLANSLRGMGAGAQPPLFEGLARVTPPVLLVAGGEDAKFRAIAERLVRELPDARTAVVAGAGHAAHLEAPHAFAGILEAFLASAEAHGVSRAHAVRQG